VKAVHLALSLVLGLSHIASVKVNVLVDCGLANLNWLAGLNLDRLCGLGDLDYLWSLDGLSWCIGLVNTRVTEIQI
jgi:hypothetical protein